MKLSAHILKEHKKCKVCAKVFQNSKSLGTHTEAVHIKPKLKHSLEREQTIGTRKTIKKRLNVKKFNSQLDK